MPPNRPGSPFRRYRQALEKRPDDLRLPLGVPATLRAVGRAYVRRLWPLLVALSVPLAPAFVLVALFSALSPHTLVDGALVPLQDPEPWQTLMRGTAAVSALVGAAVGLGAAVVLGSAELMGRYIPVTAAWRIALRRVPALVAWLAGTVALSVGALWAGIVLFPEGDVSPPVSVLVLLPPYLLCMAVWSVALSAALLEGREPVDAVRRAWELGIGCRPTHMLLTLVSTAAAVSASVATEFAVGLIAVSGADQLLALAVRGTLLTLAVPLVVLLLCTPGVHESASSPWDLDLARVDRYLPAAGTTSWPFPRATVPLLAAAVVLPTAALPLATALSPNTTPQLVAEPLSPRESGGNHMSVSDDGTMVFLKGSGQNRLTVCTPECEGEYEAEWRLDREAYEGSASSVAVAEGGYAALARAAGPETEPDSDPDPWDAPPVGTDTLNLVRCSGPGEHGCDDLHTAELREIPDVDLPHESVPAPMGDGIVAATYVDPDPRVERDGLDHLNGLRAHVCHDIECSDPHEVDLDEALEQTDRFHRDETARADVELDVAASPDGGFAVTVEEPDSGSSILIHCADTACSDPVATELTRQINASSDTESVIRVSGASIEYRPDGTPVIAHIDTQQSGTHLVDCHDAACTESTSRALTDSVYRGTSTHAPPGLAIDSQGLPQVATADLDAWKLVLVSCLDTACSEHTTIPLSEFGEQPWMTSLELDGQDRPHLVWGRSVAEDDEGLGLWDTGHSAEGEYLRCTQPRCGAPGP